jgi:DNA-binding MarR family transcriptional regulator
LTRKRLTDKDYRRLARWRHALRRFLRFSEAAARREGISLTQHHLLTFVRAFRGGAPTIADLAELLQIRHQSTVGLVDRCERSGLVRRRRDPGDRRRVFVELTPRAGKLLSRLTLGHLRELARLREAFPLRLDGVS